MNQKTISILEDVISQGVWDWLEFDTSSDSLYLEFFNLKLSSNPIYGPSSYNGELAIRFANNMKLEIFYDELDDLKFLNLDSFHIGKIFNDNIQLSELSPYFYRDFSQKLTDFRFQDYDLLEDLKSKFKNKRVLVGNNLTNDSFDFMLVFILENMAVAAFGNSINFFNDSQSLDDDEIKKASNNWVLYYLKYWLRKGTSNEYEEDALCEENPLK